MFIFPKTVQTLVRRYGITNHHSIAYSLSNITTKNYHKRSCSKLSLVSTLMGDRIRVGIPAWYVIRSTQPCIPLGSQNQVPALIGRSKGGNITSDGWQVTLYYPIWHISSHSSEAFCQLLYPVTLLYFTKIG